MRLLKKLLRMPKKLSEEENEEQIKYKIIPPSDSKYFKRKRQIQKLEKWKAKLEAITQMIGGIILILLAIIIGLILFG